MSIELVMPSNHLTLCCPLLLPLSIFPNIRVFSNESFLRSRWPKYWSFSFSISPSNEYSGLISFRIDWFDLLAVQGTLKSLSPHHSSKASVLQCSAFFIVQLSHPYMTTRKTIALTRWTWVWASSQSWWWTGKPGLLQSIGSQRVEHNWATELNWTWDFTSVIFFLQVYDPSLTTKKHQTSSSQGTSNNILYQYSSKVLMVLTL